MSPEDRLRQLRDPDRWMNLPPSGARAAGRSRAWLPGAIATAVVVLIVVVASIGLLGLPHAGPAAPSHTVSPTGSPRPTPTGSANPSAAPLLQPSAIVCGARASDAQLEAVNERWSAYSTGHPILQIQNFSAADARTTRIGMLIAAGQSGFAYSGALHFALVKGGRVFAQLSDVGRQTGASGRMPADGSASPTALVRADRGCDGGVVADGEYSIVAFGSTFVAGATTTHPLEAGLNVWLERGLLKRAKNTTATDGPWLGTGSPLCGTPVSLATLRSYQATNLSEQQRHNISVKVFAISVDATTQFDFLDVRLTNTGRSTITIPYPRPVTTLIRNGAVVGATFSTPEQEPIAASDQPQAVTIAPGKSATIQADAPRAGCELPGGGPFPFPLLAKGTYTAYVDLGAFLSDGFDPALIQSYSLGGSYGRPTIPGIPFKVTP